MARIDAPRLDYFRITSCDQFHSDTPRLDQFISRTPTLKLHDEAHVIIDDGAAKVMLTDHDLGLLTIEILFGDSDFQLSSLLRISASSLPFLSMVQRLYIYEN